MTSPEPIPLLRAAAERIGAARHLVAFTGAGISTESGLPDFRGPDGVWTRRDKGLPPPRSAVPWHEVAPNRGHHILTKWQDEGRLAFLISQNVDNLHRVAGIHDDRIAELHGNSVRVKCLACDARFGKAEVGWDDARFGPGYRTQRPVAGQPACPACGERLISSVVNFQDPMPERELEQATAHAESCDVFLVIGSSLSVTPAADLPVLAQRSGACLLILNRGPTELDAVAEIRIEGSAGEMLMAIDATL